MNFNVKACKYIEKVWIFSAVICKTWLFNTHFLNLKYVHINVHVIKHKYIRYHILDQLSNKQTKTTHTHAQQTTNLDYEQNVSLC